MSNQTLGPKQINFLGNNKLKRPVTEYGLPIR